MSVIKHQNNFATNLTSNQIAGVTTTPLNSIPSVAAPFYLAFDATNLKSKYEVVYCTSKTATNVLHAATTYAHTTAEEVRMVVPAAEFDNFMATPGTDGVYPLNAPQGFLINGKISVTDTGSGLTVAIKTLAGTDPSASDPVYCRIGDTVRTISAALSVTKADGTNWCNAGSSELATKEIDYFVYLGYNATDGVVIGFSRIPSASQYSDFSTTTTNEKYCAISTITTAASTDYYEVVGRFAATLSAGAGYTWSVPTFTAQNLIQRPIYETRTLSFTPTITVSAGTAPTYTGAFTNNYQVVGAKLKFSSYWSNTAAGTAGAGTNPIFSTIPFIVSGTWGILGYGDVFESGGTTCTYVVKSNGTNSIYFSNYSFINIVGNDQSSTSRTFSFRGEVEI